MKKRYMAGLVLALVGALSGCGQAKTQPADNTISITPVERKTDGPQMDMAVKYDFAGNHADVNGMEFRRYIWDGSAWENEGGTFTVNLDKVEENEGTIRFQPESDVLNAEYIVIIDCADTGIGKFYTVCGISCAERSADGVADLGSGHAGGKD